MKKLVIVLFVFCSVLFVTNPIFKSSFANNESKSSNEATKVDKPTAKETENKALETNTVSDIDDSDSNKDVTAKKVSNTPNKDNSDLESKKEVSNVKASDDKKVSKTNETNKKDDIVKPNDSKNKVETNKPSESNNVIENDKSKEPVKNKEDSVAKTLTKDDALKLLLDMNPNLVYAYQGDENTFSALKNKGLSGYVFLPNVDTDLGYFVDKNTSSIYYFHPSGYLEKIK
ncbi:hypothetical protein LZ906_005890 [Paraclostridium ghonii]|uniref:hypothetical protein n=1 Tax=Paraclostridium ghonii TaxID=29358 RepID=UPI00202CD624|nr:hypothetical protein [Paeniclostridium ghonii]MCM0165351.1 hypothetical protein [Paeniclostridium ghonii]